MDAFLQDIRYAFRTLAKARGFTAIAVLCLGLGIAANVSVFTPVNTLLLRPLPFEDPGKLVSIYMTQLTQGKFEGSWSYQDYKDLGNAGGTLEATALVGERSWNLGGLAEPERVEGARVTASLFPLLGLRVELGRNIREDEEAAGKVMLVSHGFWQRRFGGDSTVVGRALTVNGEPYTVIGVLQRGIRFPETADVWLPLEPGEAKDRRDWRNYELVARLAPGTSEAEAEANVMTLTRRLAQQFPETNEGWSGWLQNYRENVASDVRPMMLILLGAVGFVLLIACANVANLLLARATARHKEIAVRLALGAGRGRIIRQLLTESIILALLGGVVGVLLGTWAVDAIVHMLPSEMPFWMTFEVDGRVIAMTLALSMVTGIIFGLAPALQASSPALSETLKDNSRGATSGARTGRLRSTLVITEIALSIILLVGATLMIRSFLLTQEASLGFDSRTLLTLETSLQGERYESDSVRDRAFSEMLASIARVPGVLGAAGAARIPVASCCSWTPYSPPEKQYRPGESPYAMYNAATPGFFRTMGTALLAGREFDERDAATAPRVAIVNQTLVDRTWPGESPLGKRLRIDVAPDSAEPAVVVGVVNDIVQENVTDEPRAQLYVPFAQSGYRTMGIVVRTAGDPTSVVTAVRGEIRRMDGDLPVGRVRSMPQVVREEMFEGRVYGLMFGMFAFAALFLASIGLYGVMAYSVAQRTHEIGVRMALGAQPGDVLRLVVRNGARLTMFGLLIGVPAALGLSQLLRGMLFGVSPTDPLTFIGISMLLAAVALLASYIPARRATRVDPVTALRSE